MKYLLTLLLLLGFIAIVVDNSGKDYWKNIGPKWDCAFNPDYSEYCDN